MITEKDYEDALTVQSAINLTAVLNSMLDVAKRSDRWDHPVLRMYAEQVMTLTGGHGDYSTYKEAADIVLQHLGERS